MYEYITINSIIEYNVNSRFKNFIFSGINRVEKQYGVFGTESGRNHKGIDIDTTDNDILIHSTVTGKVKYARSVNKSAAGWGNTWEWGYFVWVVDNLGYDHIFAHCKENSLLVKEGSQVNSGQSIASMGMTGNAMYDSQKEHVHYEVRKNGSSIDPTPWCGMLNKQGYVNPKEEDTRLNAMSTQPVRMWFGPMTGSDKTTFINEMTKLKISYEEVDGKIVTVPPVSGNDQLSLLALAITNPGGIGYGPVIETNDELNKRLTQAKSYSDSIQQISNTTMKIAKHLQEV